MKKIILLLLIVNAFLYADKTASLEKLDYELYKLEKDYKSQLDSANDERNFEAAIDSIRDLIKEISEDFPEESQDSVMSDNDFNTLVYTIKKQKFKNEKIAIIENVVGKNYFYLNQLKTLLGLFTNVENSEKVKVIELVFPKVTDKERSYELLSYFSFESDKRKISDIIEEESADYTPTEIIDNNSFNALVKDIRYSSRNSEKIEKIKEKKIYYLFTVNQVKSILSMFGVNASNMKLEILELIYPSIVDIQNDYRLLDEFKFETDRKKAAKIMNQ